MKKLLKFISSYFFLILFLLILNYSKSFAKNLITDVETFASEDEIYVVVEIPKNTNEKWEVSKINGNLEPDYYMGLPRIITYGNYPINYGMIPRTVSPVREGGDGDPLDVIIFGDKIKRGEIVKAKVVGIIFMEDLGQNDNKVIATLNKEDKSFKISSENTELNEVIEWFKNYKKKGYIKYNGLGFKDDALKYIKMSVKDFKRYGVKKR